ncbi:BTB/POZ domain protein [Teladorsagia circumcincta]|uniref:BTB/POZ domain protein n=1 Tax=Teladorsagia circumcincta TaxID=45464 RepID=A0A2G9USA3_TELCI|nr:BTB/POZ domain protein [Teladorsagia circumcincta]
MSYDSGASSGEEEEKKDVTKKEEIFEFEVEVVYFYICDGKGTRINAHRLVLAACSAYFKAMFTNEMAESRLKEIEMVDVEASALDALINYCYTGKIKIDDTSVLNILPASCLLQLDGVKDVVCTEEFYQLPVDRLIELISNEELHVRSEEQLLEHVRFSLCNPKFLVDTISKDELVMTDAACRDFVDEAKAVGGTCNKEKLDSVEFLDLRVGNNAWQRAAPMINKRFDPATNQWSDDVAPTIETHYSCGAAVLDGSIYAVGGSSSHDCSSSVERYDPREGKWEYIHPMLTVRYFLGSAVIDDYIYAVGGLDESGSTLSSAEKYDPRRNAWIPAPAMNSRRYGLALAVVDEKLYAVGGYDGTTELDTVEIFDPKENQWELHSRMNERGALLLIPLDKGHLLFKCADGYSEGATPVDSRSDISRSCR